jgi:hypothetical protein
VLTVRCNLDFGDQGDWRRSAAAVAIFDFGANATDVRFVPEADIGERGPTSLP